MGMSLWPHFFGPACKLKITYLLVALDLTTNDGDTSGGRVFSNDDVDCWETMTVGVRTCDPREIRGASKDAFASGTV